MIQLGPLSLPDSLTWRDQSALGAVGQTSRRRLDGGLSVFPRPLAGGRIVTLEAPADAPLTHGDWMALLALAAEPGRVLDLTIPQRGFSAQVVFDHPADASGSPAVELQPLFDYEDPEDGDPVTGTLRFLTL